MDNTSNRKENRHSSDHRQGTFQMGGRGNAAEVFTVMQHIVQQPRWQRYYEDFTPPYHFHGPEDYERWLSESGFRPLRIELIPKDMQHPGTAVLMGWLLLLFY